MKKTKIICTMGPSTDDAALLAEMMRSGMDLARFNFSHGCHEDHARRVELVRKAAAEVEKPIALIADTKGPEMRLGIFKEGRVILKEGDSFTLTTEEIEGTQEISYVNYAGLPEELQPGNAILLSDGLLALEVTDVDVQGGKIYTKVVHGGEISSRKRVACPGVELKLPFLSEQDISDITFAAKLGMDYVAASFVQKADDVLAIRRVLEEVGSSMGIISKIENHAGVKNIEEIINVSDYLYKNKLVAGKAGNVSARFKGEDGDVVAITPTLKSLYELNEEDIVCMSGEYLPFSGCGSNHEGMDKERGQRKRVLDRFGRTL